MIFENEITKKYGLKVFMDSGSYVCETERGDSRYRTNYSTVDECIIRMLDMLLTECYNNFPKKCINCNFFQYQFCTNEERIKELREKYGIIPPLKVDPEYYCERFEVE